MTADDFNAWMEHMKFNVTHAAGALGISRNSVDKYRVAGAPDLVALACAALAYGLPMWRRPA
jgi:hypothetical protein